MNRTLLSTLLCACLATLTSGCSEAPAANLGAQQSNRLSPETIAEGQRIFRYDTFGDEQLWTDRLRMHEVVQTLDPTTALAVGLKVDADAVPADVLANADLGDPATTVALLKLNAVVGVQASVDADNRITQLGITCALCHSTVDDSVLPGIGHRLDGWPNRDLDPGRIIALSPALPDATKAVYNSWGPGKYDPRFNIDGLNKPVVIPPAYGLAGIHKITFTGDGDEIAYWNRYVAVTQMGGQGTFTEPRLNLSITNGTQDLVSGVLPALQEYQLSLPPPAPPAGSFDASAAARGRLLFEGKARCSTCHATTLLSGRLFTDANVRLHPPSDSMAEPEVPSYAARSATKMYRTTPLRGAWQHPPYFHDGSAATLDQVVTVYNTRMSLGLTPQEIADVGQFLRSL
jgi:mono/diheme cytochrome c family protein